MQIYADNTVKIEIRFPEFNGMIAEESAVKLFKKFLDEEVDGFETRMDYYFDLEHSDYTGEYEIEYEEFPVPQINFLHEDRDVVDAQEFETDLRDALIRALADYEEQMGFKDAA